jgi:hypothetical protein
MDIVQKSALVAGLIALLTFGCSAPNQDAESAGKEPATELSFAEQAAAVKAGTADQIRLNETPVSDEDLDQLAGLEDHLLRLNMSHTSITDAGLAKIAAMHKLVQLRLGAPRLTDDGLALLAKLPELKHLHLIDAPITDAGLEHLHGLKNLSSLYLDNSRASNEAMGRLVEALPDVHLHFDGGHHRDDPQASHDAH